MYSYASEKRRDAYAFENVVYSIFIIVASSDFDLVRFQSCVFLVLCMVRFGFLIAVMHANRNSSAFGFHCNYVDDYQD